MSTDSCQPDTLVFDTGPLCAFARADRLETLRTVIGARRLLIPQAVVAELEKGAYKDDRIQAVLEAGWIERYGEMTDVEVAAFAKYARPLVSGERNLGEAEVLALAEAIPAIAVVDDQVANRLAQKSKVACTRTLALLCEAIREDILTIDYVGDLVDEMLAHYRFPFGHGEFARWAEENNLFIKQAESG